MTRVGKLQTLAMGFEKDFFEEDFDGLMEQDLFINDGWDEIEEEEEDFYFPVKRKKKKVHFLDRQDKILYGGFVRHLFYKQHGGKKPYVLTNAPCEDVTCRKCTNLLATRIDKSNLLDSLHFSEIYFRRQDEFNRSLPELTLALLQVFDWVGVCSCGEVHYGYLNILEETPVSSTPEVEEKVELSLQERVKQFSSRAEQLQLNSSEYLEESFSFVTASGNRREKVQQKVQQLTLFDFLEEEDKVAIS